MAKFKQKLPVIDAFYFDPQVAIPEGVIFNDSLQAYVVNTPHGMKAIVAGEYLLVSGAGDKTVVPAAVFEQDWELVIP